MEQVRIITQELLTSLGIVATYEVRVAAEHPVLEVTTEQGVDLIGIQGERVRAINLLVRMLADKRQITERFSIDINGHQKAEIDKLQKMAKEIAQRSRDMKVDVELNPMRPFDRMVVHAALSGEANIKTESTGMGKDRRIVIKYIP
jgi:spoIIIJ-associated protein